MTQKSSLLGTPPSISKDRRRVSRPLMEGADLDSPLTDVYEVAARTAGDRPFLKSLVLPEENVNYSEFRQQARAVARHLVAAGIEPGDRVAIFAENRPRWCVAYAGILYAGGVILPLDHELGEEAVRNILTSSNARGIFSSRETAVVVESSIPESFLHLSLDDDVPRTLPWTEVSSGSKETELPALEGGHKPLAILYTSGTTGNPKGVVLTHRNVRAEIQCLISAGVVSGGDVLLLFLPLHHLLSQVGSFLAAAVFYSRAVHVEVKQGEELLAAARAEGVTVLLAVPLVLHLMHDRIIGRVRSLSAPARLVFRSMLATNALLRSLGLNFGKTLFSSVHEVFGADLKLIASAGSALDPEVQRDFWKMGFDLVQAYGLTESTGAATCTPVGDRGVGTVGWPLDGVSIQIDDPDEEGVGEVLIAGDIITSGYLDLPDESKELVRDGWLYSGDLGHLDDRGMLRITGRAKEVIVLGNGKNVYPEEVEAQYVKAPHVKEVCVISRQKTTGPDRTEKLHGVVVPDFDALRKEGITSIRNTLHFELERQSLALPAWQRILSFEIRQEPLPRTATRKVRRFQVAEEAVGEDAEARELPPDEGEVKKRMESPLGEMVVGMLLDKTQHKGKVRGATSLEFDLGLDSLNRMDLLLAVERRTGVSIGDEEAESISTVDDLLLALGDAKVSDHSSDGSSWIGVIQEAGPGDLPSWLRTARSVLSRCVLWLVMVPVKVLGMILFRIGTEGKEHLPQEGAYLICPNHVSYLDGPILFCAVPGRVRSRIFSVGEGAYLQGVIASRLARYFRVVPTDADRYLRQSMKIAAAALKMDQVLVIFPEGTRSPDGMLKELKHGSAILSRELDLPIVPAWIEGAFEAWPRFRPWPRPGRVHIRFGEPLHPSQLLAGAESRDAEYQKITDAIGSAIKGLDPHRRT